MTVLSRREAAAFACLADTVLAPAPPLPPVEATDALPAFERWLSRGPRLHRVVLRGALLALAAARFGARTPDRRLAALGRLERAGARPLVEALRATAAVAYYGDPNVAAIVGYEPGSLR